MLGSQIYHPVWVIIAELIPFISQTWWYKDRIVAVFCPGTRGDYVSDPTEATAGNCWERVRYIKKAFSQEAEGLSATFPVAVHLIRGPSLYGDIKVTVVTSGEVTLKLNNRTRSVNW